MPFLADLGGEHVLPDDDRVTGASDAGATTTVAPRCTECGWPMYRRSSTTTRDGVHRAAHFAHLPTHPADPEADPHVDGDRRDAACTGGESPTHVAMKYVVSDWLAESDAIPAGTVERERSPQGLAGTRVADVLVEFDEPSETYGRGIAAEVQFRHEGKDREAVERDYLDAGYTVVWVEREAFGGVGVGDETVTPDDLTFRPTAEGAGTRKTPWPHGVPDRLRWGGEGYARDSILATVMLAEMDDDPMRVPSIPIATADRRGWRRREYAGVNRRVPATLYPRWFAGALMPHADAFVDRAESAVSRRGAADMTAKERISAFRLAWERAFPSERYGDFDGATAEALLRYMGAAGALPADGDVTTDGFDDDESVRVRRAWFDHGFNPLTDSITAAEAVVERSGSGSRPDTDTVTEPAVRRSAPVDEARADRPGSGSGSPALDEDASTTQQGLDRWT